MKLKPPFTPAKEKLQTDAEMEGIANLRVPVTQEIEKASNKFKKARRGVTSKIPNWDKDF